ncbi:hypothetical protein [Hymenobacter pini]|uniref:hypothetical protein n=1 Tax=Hymenobacter pini TaxID=2880879 RepID=UPI001CF3986E|nr:hypothetical protein [Hymenobacter pini]MCA8829275.1 hypothetical protein [Hymenobacter pini]
MRTHEVPVPAKVVKKFKRTYPDAQIDSCRVYGDLEKGEEEYMFYSKRQNKVLNVAFDRHCKFAESKTEVSVKELPLQLQQRLIHNSFNAQGIGRVFKTVGSRRRDEVEYMVECVTDFDGKPLMLYMYFKENGYPANPGFR